MWFDLLNFVFETNRAVTFNLDNFLVAHADFAACAHVNLRWQQTVLLGVDHRVRMNRNEDLVSLAMDADGVIEVLVLIVGSELHVNVLADAARDHPFLVVLYLEKRRAGWQDVQTLRSRRVVDQLHLQSVGLAQLKSCKLDDAWTSAKDAVAADCVELVLLAELVDLVSLGLGQQLAL